MGKITGFMEYERQNASDRPVAERVKDFKDVHHRLDEAALKIQAGRCMDCGIPFCHKGCPLGNIIPEWNDLIWRNRWKEALNMLLSTNNFPEFTGRICPAPCEASCVVALNREAVTIEQIELNIIEHAFDNNWIKPNPPQNRTGKKVAVVGSGPAGLAAADQLNKAGHSVTVFERASKPGGILMYGIPNFKLEKEIVVRRIELMKAEGVEFRTNAHVGVNVKAGELKSQYDAIVLAGGATKPRDLPVPGRELNGIHFAMDFLTQATKKLQGEKFSADQDITAAGKKVVVIGGGDTGSDCHGTSLRQGATEVFSLELLPQPAESRTSNNPWPEWPRILRTSSSHEEGGKRDWSVMTKKFSGENGKVKKLHLVRLDWQFNPAGGPPKMVEVPGSEFVIEADLVLLAMGFLGPETNTMLAELGVKLTDRGNVAAGKDYSTNVPGVFSCGDMRRGQSLVVWAIWEGREAARNVDQFLMKETYLPTSPLQFV